MSVTIELIYDLDCPNVSAARTQLMKAIVMAGLPPRWIEWDRSSPQTPDHARRFGSPTILVNGLDVAGEHARENSASCRVYLDGDGDLQGVPAVKLIATSVAAGLTDRRTNAGRPRSTGWRTSLGAVPGIAFVFLPKVACPACWPAYAGFFSSLGLGFLVETRFLLPLMIVFLAVALGALAFRARDRRGFAPFWLGVCGSVVILVGRFVFGSDVAMYVGIGLLVVSSLWNACPVRRPTGCGSCQNVASS